MLFYTRSQAMEASYVELAEKLAGSGMLGNLDLIVMEKVFAQQELQLGSFQTILFFPKHAFGPIKYSGDLCESVLSYQTRKQVIHEIRVFLRPGKPLTSAQI